MIGMLRSSAVSTTLSPQLFETASGNVTSSSNSSEEKFTVPLYVVILVAFGLFVIITYLYCFFCVPSTNKRKIYAMMKEAKLEDEGHR